MKKYLLTFLAFMLLTGGVFSLGNDFKNSLTKIDLRKTADNSYQIELFTQKPYMEPVKVIKKSDTSYYILLPETNNEIKTTASNADITGVSVKLFPYVGASTNNGYTKISLITSKPLEFTSKVFSDTDFKIATLNKEKLAKLDKAFESELKKETAIVKKVATTSENATKSVQKALQAPQKTVQTAQKVSFAKPKVPATKKVAQKANIKPALKPMLKPQAKVAQKTSAKTKIVKTVKPVKNIAKTTKSVTKTKKIAQKPVNLNKTVVASKKIAQNTVKPVEKQIQKPVKPVVAPVEPVATKPVTKTKNIKQETKQIKQDDVKYAAASKLPIENIKKDVGTTNKPLTLKEIIKNNILLIITSIALLTALFTTLFSRIDFTKINFKLPKKREEDEKIGLDNVKTEENNLEDIKNADDIEDFDNEPKLSEILKPIQEDNIEEEIVDTFLDDELKFDVPKIEETTTKARLDIAKLKGEEVENEKIENIEETVENAKEKLDLVKEKLDASNASKINRLKAIRDRQRHTREILGQFPTEDEITVSMDEIIPTYTAPKVEIKKSISVSNSIVTTSTQKTDYMEQKVRYDDTVSSHPRGFNLMPEKSENNILKTSNNLNNNAQSPIKPKSITRGDEAKILSSVKVENDRGFYVAEYGGRYSLIGFINDNIFVIHSFKEPLNDTKLSFRLLDSYLDKDYYMVKVDNKKIIVKSTKEKLKLEASVK